jgi:putative Holliday junction resolvase
MMYLGIDYGKKRIGLALGQMIPKGAGVIDGAQDLGAIISQIEKICRENEVEGIVIGLPIKKSGDLGEIAPEIEKFVSETKSRLNLPVFFEEEELTSVEAESILTENGQQYDRKSGKIDELAAILILEQHLNKKNRSSLKDK